MSSLIKKHLQILIARYLLVAFKIGLFALFDTCFMKNVSFEKQMSYFSKDLSLKKKSKKLQKSLFFWKGVKWRLYVLLRRLMYGDKKSNQLKKQYFGVVNSFEKGRKARNSCEKKSIKQKDQTLMHFQYQKKLQLPRKQNEPK
ncbi:hypothetical protein RFI_15587 [Reticulomyxa filosa]|uniref:Transmembrane protein n=1 Tax=Reticulomyxa filosa TaxID=46433 RepID=X6N784_RETFI|nr:hypothetical protein RFI_15587 [Reticulomyxa filosa]|eukprot:ETO21619.1 hypothetical protein RFI_15587 [Reticulomyxa filosa]